MGPAPEQKGAGTPSAPPATNGEAGKTAEPLKEAETVTAEMAVAQETIPVCEVAQLIHELRLPEETGLHANTKERLLELIKKNDMLPLYQQVCEEFRWPVDQTLAQSMEMKHKEELEAIDARLEEAKEKYGDVEVRDALLSRANFYCRIGDLKQAVKAYDVAYQKTVGTGGKIDITLTLIRLGFIFSDQELVKKYLARAEEELEKGGDWERRNKMKVYKGLHLVTCRQFKEAAQLFLGVLATFPTCSLFSFEKFIFYAVLLALLTEDRRALREQLLTAPPVLEGADEELKNFLRGFFYGRYREFIRVKCDLYLGRHYLYFIRAIRLRAYAQFLEPYKSVTIDNMATAFGVSPSFIEAEVSSFISSGKLSCRIDRVNAVIESNRPDERSRSYLRILKQGDLLLNRIQKLSRVIAM
ncbi:putative 26S proteasome non-ATPase regulatory subunit [Neospora caninum Liverpool]|uniref:26S proteasome non-ATPase regulatory subunit,putative n=1 Tax=Neospora caninum (strain Liverpool) TaxID=572307 RepID=F0VDH0_NEOCL|nr:putative 26S proteasome non-ATPase regulatory subunit [Neospora caninum Liverpool]CBZ51763.1 putative 26S proteasome non-ATPase regulatory subunit [Neospora caninum Liverpool]CEL65720.1 TPA: 26S proteasome non-ATPase regulatory subunit,putative [Neospora caninum Liverpool]|eukprot:XP_003881796.1 putative 26S proteasome non-ATPase regulatory subunit [Neospora caninum Liverpool]